MYKRVHILLWFLLIGLTIIAQPALDTITSSFKEKPHLFAKIDSRNSFISNSRAKIFGAKLGLNFANRVRIGVGYNQLIPPAQDFNKPVYYTNVYGLPDSVMSRLRLFYVSAHVEYVFYQTKHWELSIPLQLGVGKTFYKYEWFGQKLRKEENLNLIYEPSVSVSYRFVKWLGVGTDIGFRFMVTGDRKLIQKFTSPTYTFKLQIFYNEIYKAILKKKKE